KSHNQLNDTAHGVRMLNKDLFNTKFKLQIQNILIVTKHYDDTLIFITAELLEHILTKYVDVSVYLEEKMFFKNENLELDEIFKKCCHSQEDIENFKSRIKYYDQDFIQKHNNLIDLVITLGGDGTVLYVSNIFQRNVPPVMSFSLGSLGFLTNFEFENYHKSLEKLFTKKITTKLRMRLSCIVVRESTNEIIERQILNELVIDRGPSPFISNLEVYGNGSLLTVAQADGLIIATPTGSTAYSLSAGGSLVYPEVNALCITPICPHTLSFRPIILPDSMILTVKVPKDSRSTAWCSFDGKNRLELFKGDKVYVRASEYSFPTVEAKKTEFIDSISRSLNWNRREPQKSLGHLLSGKNKSKY
ncbi:ATP-NAD kinase, partial [Hanseniaspora valbyensis NRRL Y-1626]